jgi:protein-S-isoprenylcysteine O-methyltransferase Ste14
MSVYRSAIIVLWIFFLAVWAIETLIMKEKTHRSDAFQWFLTRGVTIVALVGFFHVEVFNWGNFTPAPFMAPAFLRLFGVLVCAGGIAFSVWARAHLGTSWAMPMVSRVDPELIVTGPYAHVRHPIYSGILLAMLGSALVYGEVWLSICIVFFVYFIYASTQEEKVMQEEFKERYTAYRKKTRMLIPYVF